jgi:predicted Zn-dependent protease
MTETSLNIAECYKQLGQIDQALDCYKGFINSNPESPKLSEVKAMIRTLRSAPKIYGDVNGHDYIDALSAKTKGLVGWPHATMPVKIFIESGDDVPGYEKSFRQLILSSLRQWAGATHGRMLWKMVAIPSEADIVFHWTNDKKDFPHGGEQGICKIVCREHSIQHADVTICTVHLKSDESKPLKQDEMEEACLHEIGHALGLSGHSTNNNDAMFFCMRPSPVTLLTERDQNTIAHLYEKDFVEYRLRGTVVGIPGLFGIRF